MSSSPSSKLKSDVDQLDDLVKDLLNEVNRPISNNTNNNNNNNTQRYSYQRQLNNDLPNSKLSSSSIFNDGKRSEVEISSTTVPRSKTTREERIRIKRGTPTTEIPSPAATTTTTTKSQIAPSSIDEQLIDSLLESVQNTLKKRAQKSHSTTTADIPIQNRRTYSSSTAYPDSIHRMDPNRSRFPIKLYRTDSSTSTLSSKRPYSRQDYRDGYTSASTTVIPNCFRATSEPPPEGPIELRRMDLVRSPSRTYVDSHGPNEYCYYPRSTLASSGVRIRGPEYSGYETDTGLMTSRVYPPRYYRVPQPTPPPPPPPQLAPMYPFYRYHECPRSMPHPDGYDTDSGLVSSGRLHMTRTLPPRMAVIPETIIINNRMTSAANLNRGVPTNYRNSSCFNQVNRSQNLTGYETDSGMNTRQYHTGYRRVPVDIQYGNNEWSGNQSTIRAASQQRNFVDSNQSYRQAQEQFRSTSIPVFSQHSEQQQQQQQRTTTITPSGSSSSIVKTTKNDIPIKPTLFPGSVGLSNPLSDSKSQQLHHHHHHPHHQQQQQTSEIEIKRKISNDNVTKRAPRPHGAIIESTVLQAAIDPGVTDTKIIPTTVETINNVNVDNQAGKLPSTLPTFPVNNQSHNANIQTRAGNNSLRNQDDSSRRSSVSSMTDSDVHRNGAYQAHNVSQFWYKEKLSREDAINLLKTKPPGTFLIRDSQGFPGSYGLAVKVETLPPGINPKPGADPNVELVRHYLIERISTGHVRLKGCPNEPDFANLSALVYQHTISALALPTKLVLPTADIAADFHPTVNHQQETKKVSIKDLLEKGAACNVVYLNNVDVESLSGQMAVAKALNSTFENAERLQATIVNFKVSNTGITLTDIKKKLFSRRHFPKEYVTYCGVDYEAERFWTYRYNDIDMLARAKCFGFVSKKINGAKSSQQENECHIFAEVDLTQPATAIVNFVSKVMIGSIPV
ncbi:unnamed protein product [Rotaria magnacalcarata]|uniref:SH2 domain-containing protein n=1 Tax=Rotaria magnacalcarata TaxID=392030 RepID=A0A816MGJ3_9BILA|nr:unnamed protein product [Rotaria magnacalcarata]CAF2156384.1 unnamed protein product [Rotaria magnacalcarata]CAF3770085.1 unnamed protein product [Rotaria magnacalcarata]